MNSKMIKGAVIIGIAGIVVKVLGAFFRIPVINWIGDDGMAYYGVAYSIYAVLIVLATAGLPVAISRLVSENIAQKRYLNAHKVFKVSLTMMSTLGATLFVLCYLGADIMSKMVGLPEAATAVRAISPALFFVPVLASFRGYFQGRQNMNPTAVSELAEQLIRVFVGLFLAWNLLKSGLPKAAAGATFGATAGAAGALCIILIIFFFNKKPIHTKIIRHDQTEEDTKVIIRQILTVAIPILIGSEVMPIMNFIDTGIITNRLVASGWSPDKAKTLFGMLSGQCNTLIGFPQIFTQAVAISLVPAVASEYAIGKIKNVRDNIYIGKRMTMIMAFPCALGMIALAKPILILLFRRNIATVDIASVTLSVMAVGIVFVASVQTSTGVLQAIGKQKIPVYTLIIGAVIKLVLSYVFVGIPSINVVGAAISSVIAYATVAVLNGIYIKKHLGIEFEFKQTYIKPLIASICMGIVAFLTYKAVNLIAGNSISTVIAILMGVVSYGTIIIALKAVTHDELSSMPMGSKLNRIIGKFIKWE